MRHAVRQLENEKDVLAECEHIASELPAAVDALHHRSSRRKDILHDLLDSVDRVPASHLEKFFERTAAPQLKSLLDDVDWLDGFRADWISEEDRDSIHRLAEPIRFAYEAERARASGPTPSASPPRKSSPAEVITDIEHITDALRESEHQTVRESLHDARGRAFAALDDMRSRLDLLRSDTLVSFFKALPREELNECSNDMAYLSEWEKELVPAYPSWFADPKRDLSSVLKQALQKLSQSIAVAQAAILLSDLELAVGKLRVKPKDLRAVSHRDMSRQLAQLHDDAFLTLDGLQDNVKSNGVPTLKRLFRSLPPEDLERALVNAQWLMGRKESNTAEYCDAYVGKDVRGLWKAVGDLKRCVESADSRPPPARAPPPTRSNSKRDKHSRKPSMSGPRPSSSRRPSMSGPRPDFSEAQYYGVPPDEHDYPRKPRERRASQSYVVVDDPVLSGLADRLDGFHLRAPRPPPPPPMQWVPPPPPMPHPHYSYYQGYGYH